MQGIVAGGRRGNSLARHDTQHAPLGENTLDAMPKVTPRSHVGRLFLDPAEVPGIRVTSKQFGEFEPWERIQLLDPHDRGARIRVRHARFKQRVVEAPRGQQHGGHRGRFGSGPIVDHGAVPLRGERRQRRDCQLVPQQALGAHDDQRLAEWPVDLPPEDVEQLRGRRGVAHLHVAASAQLEEAFEAGARVFGALPLVTVRQ